MSRAPFERQLADLRPSHRWIAGTPPAGEVIELPGVTAVRCHAVRERALFNSVVPDGPEPLEAALPRLAELYDETGAPWTVWVPDFDARSAELLAAAGHVLDAEPAAMEARLRELDLPDPGDLDWDAATLDEVARVNDAAYPWDGGPFSRGLVDAPEWVHLYAARLGGEAVSVAAVLDIGSSASLFSVATLPEARGRGLSYRLLGRALAEARERGLEWTTLQATRAGEPVYVRLGYRTAFRFHMWERPATASP